MNFYHEWKRFYIDFSLDVGRYPERTKEFEVGLAALNAWRESIKDDPEAHGIVHVGAQTATVTVEPLNPVSQTTGD